MFQARCRSAWAAAVDADRQNKDIARARQIIADYAIKKKGKKSMEMPEGPLRSFVEFAGRDELKGDYYFANRAQRLHAEERSKLNELLKERAKLTGTTLESELGGQRYGGGIGFGQADKYGFGGKVDEKDEVYRFKENVDEDAVPEVLKKKGKTKGWSKGDNDGKKLEALAKKANRRRLAYSGISA